MSELNKGACLSFGKKAHDYKKKEALDGIAPLKILEFGSYNSWDTKTILETW